MEKVLTINNRQSDKSERKRIIQLMRRAVLRGMLSPEEIKNEKACVSLTFDDGPDGRYTPKILDILRKFEAKACFFLVGKKVEKNPDIVMRIFDEGHDIGNHTYSHPVSPIFRYGIIEREIERTDKLIERITRQRPYLFRPTWSPSNINSKKMLNTAKRLDYLSVRWSVSSMDWLGIKKLIKYKVLNRNMSHGDILLLHDGAEKTPLSKREATVELLPDILRTIKRKRLFPLKLSELLQVQDRPLTYF